MEIDDIWLAYSSKVASIILLMRSSNEATNEELKALDDYYKKATIQPELEMELLDEKEIHQMFFKDICTGQIRNFGRIKLSLKECSEQLWFRKNRQYQWLLASAYEEYVEFMQNLYAYCGYKDSNFWSLKDYGEMKLAEIKLLSFDDYLKKAKEIKNPHKHILSAFRNSFPNLNGVETNNKLDVNLKLILQLIEKLRHVIVHNGGKTEKYAIIAKIFKDSGVAENKPDIEYIEQYFENYKNVSHVVLTEIPMSECRLKLTTCPLDILVKYLMSYSFFLYESAKLHIENLNKQNTLNFQFRP